LLTSDFSANQSNRTLLEFNEEARQVLVQSNSKQAIYPSQQTTGKREDTYRLPKSVEYYVKQDAVEEEKPKA
jgi:hypothetical protein